MRTAVSSGSAGKALCFGGAAQPALLAQPLRAPEPRSSAQRTGRLLQGPGLLSAFCRVCPSPHLLPYSCSTPAHLQPHGRAAPWWVGRAAPGAFRRSIATPRGTDGVGSQGPSNSSAPFALLWHLVRFPHRSESLCGKGEKKRKRNFCLLIPPSPNCNRFWAGGQRVIKICSV